MASVKGPTASSLAPSLINDPAYTEQECGPYKFEFNLPADFPADIASILAIDESTGEVSVTSLHEEDEGEYEIGIVASLANYPKTYKELSLKIEI